MIKKLLSINFINKLKFIEVRIGVGNEVLVRLLLLYKNHLCNHSTYQADHCRQLVYQLCYQTIWAPTSSLNYV